MSKKAAKKKAPAKSKKKKAEKVEAVPRETKSELSRFDGDMYERRAKGFSFGELAAAGLTFTVARVMGLPVDIRRRSSIDGNVSALKSWYVPAPKKAKEPKEPKAEKKAKPAKAAKKASKKTKKE
jgi:ribosomal protein L13E